jgi:hypothetical protein
VSSRKRVVVADASVLINLIHVDALQLLRRLARFEFVVVEHVVQEITRPDQAAALAHAMQRGWIRRESLDRPDGLEVFADLRGSSIEARPQVWLGLSSKVLRLHAMTEGHVERRQFGSAQGVSSRPQACCSRPFGMGCSPLTRRTQSRQRWRPDDSPWHFDHSGNWSDVRNIIPADRRGLQRTTVCLQAFDLQARA